VGSRSREKGAEAERAAARILSIVYPDAKRRVTGEESQQEALGRDIKGTPGLCVQVKEMGTPRPFVALTEAIEAAQPGEIPIALVRQSSRSHSTPFRVVMRLEDALHLLSTYREFGEQYAPPCYSEIMNSLDHLAASDKQMKARVGR
jgi:hypothetical protein